MRIGQSARNGQAAHPGDATGEDEGNGLRRFEQFELLERLELLLIFYLTGSHFIQPPSSGTLKTVQRKFCPSGDLTVENEPRSVTTY